MAKKKNKNATSQPESLTASRNGDNNGRDQKRKKSDHLSGLIKVLRPKVFITDSSSFKRLVQELTGNGSPASSCPETASPTTHAPTGFTEDDEGFRGEPECGFEASSEFFNEISLSLDQEFNPVSYGETGLEDMDLELLAYWDVEKWLLNSTENGCDQSLQDVSVYDYELSGML